MTGYKPLILLWLAAAVALTAWLEDVTARALHRFDEWLERRRELRRLDQMRDEYEAAAKALHPSSRGGAR